MRTRGGGGGEGGVGGYLRGKVYVIMYMHSTYVYLYVCNMYTLGQSLGTQMTNINFAHMFSIVKINSKNISEIRFFDLRSF